MAHKPRTQLSYRTRMHHYAWSIVCVLLLVTMGSLWVQAQSLTGKVSDLEKQLIASKRPAPSTCKVVGDWKSESTTVLKIDGREFGVHLPKNFLNYVYYPLVMFYPGKGATAEAAQAAYGLDSLPAIVVYPHPTMSTDGHWAWQGAPYSSNANDVQFTADILEKVQDDLCVDRTRIYAIGMSNGGGFTSLLSCKLSDKFAAYAVVAGAMYSPAGDCKPPRPSPLISVNGDSDGIVPYDGSLARKLPPIDSWTKRRAELNGCKTPTMINDGVQAVVTVWNQCDDNAVVQNIRVVGGQHSWGEVTNDTLWQFLSKFSL